MVKEEEAMKKKLLLSVLSLAFLLPTCGQTTAAPAPTTEGMLALSPEERDKLTFEELMAEEYMGDGPVENRYFTPVGESAPVVHAFEGTLTVPWTEMANTAPQAAREGNEGLRWFSPFSTHFFTYEDFWSRPNVGFYAQASLTTGA
jgi:hypothetical protein